MPHYWEGSGEDEKIPEDLPHYWTCEGGLARISTTSRLPPDKTLSRILSKHTTRLPYFRHRRTGALAISSLFPTSATGPGALAISSSKPSLDNSLSNVLHLLDDGSPPLGDGR